MSTAKHDDGLTKFQRYRRARQARGLKLLRVWVLDPTASGFRAEVQRQGALLREAPEELEALHFIEAATDRSEP